jgi:rod shape-determining protein MreD
MTASQGISTARGLNPLGWLGLPILACVLATMLLSLPIRVFGLALPQPVFPMIVAFAWPLIRPSLLTPFALLLLGFFLDLFTGGPQGLWPLCLLVEYAAVLFVRRLMTGAEFLVVWLWYAAATAAAFGTGFLLMVMFAGTAPNLFALGWQYLWTLALFPFAQALIRRYEDADVRFR